MTEEFEYQKSIGGLNHCYDKYKTTKGWDSRSKSWHADKSRTWRRRKDTLSHRKQRYDLKSNAKQCTMSNDPNSVLIIPLIAKHLVQ